MKPAWLPRFTAAELLFSAKTFVAAMLAMYLANRAGLPRPFWALLTVYVVANPLAGAVRSKGLYRVLGTILGSAAALLLVPALSNAPELLALALGLWTATCLFVSLMDRTPRAYVFLLAGYTAAIVGFPSVQMPQQIFDTAVARVEEITLAILCATLVHSLVFPTGLGPTLLALMDRTLGNTRQWIADLVASTAVAAAGAPQALSIDRGRVAGDLTQLRLLSTHVPFDTSHLRWTSGAIGAMQDQVAALTPALSAIEDRLAALRTAEGELRPDVVAVLDAVGRWLESAAPTDPADRTATLRASIRALGDDAGEAPSAWGRALRIGLSVRLEDLVDGWQECAALRADVDAGLTGQPMRRRTTRLGNRVLHRDYGMAALSAFAALVAICACNLFWIATAWSSGSGAALMAAVFCSFFATMDDPVPAIYGFLRWTIWSIPLSAVFVLVLMPLVHDFGMLVTVCAPVFLVVGCYIGRPTTVGAALPLFFGIAGALSLYDTSSGDIASFANSMAAQVLGITCAALVTALVRSVGADWSARRIQRAIWREIGDMAAATRAAEPTHAFAVRMLDRIGLLSQRQPAPGAPADRENESLVDLRIGIDIARLQQVRARLASGPVTRVLSGLSGFFTNRSALAADARPPTLLADLDVSLHDALALAERSDERRSAITSLVGLRRNLFPAAAPLGAPPRGVPT